MTYSKKTYIADTKISLTNLYDYYTVELAKTAYKHISQPDESPTIYHKTIIQNSNVKDTRAMTYKNLKLPKFNTNYVKNSFTYCIASTWNSLPYPVKLKNTSAKFNDAVRRYVIERPE